MTLEIPAYLESPPDQVPPPPPVATRPQELPFGQITWENFERLCLRLARRETDIRQCFLYGQRGQDQRGIDFIGYAGDVLNRQVRVYQCKREATFGPTRMRETVDEFLAGNWDPKPTRFVVCSSIPLRSTDVQEEIRQQISRLDAAGIEFHIWDADVLSERLKGLPDLVDDFFGRAWVDAFNGPETVAHLGSRLPGHDVATLRRRLFTLYVTLFDRHDPGLPGSLDRRVPYLERYVPPDIGEHRSVTLGTPPLPTPGTPAEQITKEVESRETALLPGQPGLIRREHPISQREFITESREPALQWLPKGKRTVVLGEPGIGKSAMLRFVALTLLDLESPHQDLGYAWAERLPLWISFSAWTRAISLNEAISLEDFLFTWLHQHSADDLQPLLSQALTDHRLLLLIDGLDERSQEEAANVALDRLDAFLAEKDIPVVLTSRPTGYERLRRPSGEWRHGRLLDFNDQQVRALAHFWFSWLTLPPQSADGPAATAAKQAVQRHTEEFVAQLMATPRVRDLAGVPLLLTLLIDLSISEVRLPEHRIKAYDKMVEYLLTVHPARRRRAAGLTHWDEPIPWDDTKEAMGRLALRIHQDHGGGYASTETCLDVFIDYLSDLSEGPGYPAHEARAKASRIIQNIREGLGLLVERGIDELGFIHLTIQEYLSAWAIARKSEAEQALFIELHWRDPRWREVILALLGIYGVLRRDRQRFEALVDHLRSRSQSELDRCRLWPLLAETVFGDLGFSPARGRALAEEILNTTEQSPFASLRKALAPVVVQGLRSEHLRETVSNRLRIWFPARSEYTRRDLLLHARNWKPADDLRGVLLTALGDEDAGCRIAAASALSQVFISETDIGELLLSYARRSVRPELREAALIAVARGWPNLGGVPDALEAALTDRYPGIRLSAALGRIDVGVHDERDFDILWSLVSWDGGLPYYRREEIPRGIIKGWPQSEKIKEVFRELIENRWRKGYRKSELLTCAAKVLIESFPGDDQVALLLAEEIRSNEFPFGFDRHEVWGLLARHFRRHPALTDAVASHLRLRRERYPAIYPGPEETHAIVVVGTSELRDQLISSFAEGDSIIKAYWTAAALVEGWPEDARVSEFLREQFDGPVKIAAEIAPFINRLGVDPSEQRQRLLLIVKNPDAPRVWLAFSTLLEISSPPDEEILDAGLFSLRKERPGYEDESMKRLLIQAFPADERVETLAWELWNQPDSLSGFLATVYSSHPGFRPRLLAAMRPADTLIRGQIAEALGTRYVPIGAATPILKGFLHEHDPTVRITAALSLASHAQHDQVVRQWLVSVLNKEITALGMHYDERRAAAVAALLRLGRGDLIQNARDHGDKPVHLDYGLQPWKQSPPLVREFLRAWNKLKELFGDGFYERFGTERKYFWEVAAPWIGEFPYLRAEFEEFLRTTVGKPVGPNTLYAMAGLFPKSDEFRETCLETLQSSDFRPDPTLIAARLLGEHYRGDAPTLDRLRSIQGVKYGPIPLEPITYWRRLLALCYGWPEEPEIQEWLKKPSDQWGGMPWHIALHLKRISGHTGQLRQYINAILRQNNDRVELVDDEISHALKLWVTEERNRSQLQPLLDEADPSLVASAVGLLSASGPIGPDLRHSFEVLFERELSSEMDPPRVGLDLSVGSLRVVAESIFDAL